ncbi:MAG: DUF1641 domain-containing protein [Syntrophales bacterium]|nr:DUF1641 domain-containing protein [Syntrophales bacterium]MDD5641210.1 DUF1641 domain-containing protein [Syntrophales bacterium]
MNAEEQILARLARIEEKLNRVTDFEEQWGKFGQTWESLSDLGRDLSLVMGPGARLLTEELAEVETGFQLEDALFFLKRLLLSFRHIAWSLEQMENLIDWWRDMEPLLKIAVPHLVDKLDDLEQRGVFRINSAIINMYAKLASAYTPEDVEIIGDGFVRMHGIVKKFADPVVIQSIEAVVNMYAKLASVYTPADIDSIGDGFVRMHGIVKKFGDPQVVDFLDRLTDVPSTANLEEARPVGPFSLPFRMMNKECKQGLGVALELTRALGKIKNGRAQPVSPES